MSSIAIQGVKGAFHDEAAKILVPEADSVPCVTFQEVFENVLTGETEYGIVAVENSIHGSINQVYRLLERHDLWVAGETTLQIEQYLIGPEPITVAELDTVEAEVRTMFPAFAQCELWLSEHLSLAKRVELYDTAFSVQSVVDEGNPLYVAIAGKHAAETYGGTIIEGPINDDPHNNTRFILLTKDRQDTTDANRTSIIMTVGHTKGCLYNAIGCFAEADINLSKLDSHPIPGDSRNYAFYIDLDAGIDDPAVQSALEKVQKQGSTVKVLGSYKV